MFYVMHFRCICGGNNERKGIKILREVAAENLNLRQEVEEQKVVILTLKMDKKMHKTSSIIGIE